MASIADYEELKSLYHREGMEVVLVRHRMLKEERILKRIRKTKDGGEDTLGEKQLEQEAGILSEIKHPGIPIIYDYWEDDESICLIEEYIQGLSLQEYFLYYEDISIRQILTYMVKICDVICYLHEQRPPILYQDLKPEHVIIQGERPVLIDYGIARRLKEMGTGTKGYGSWDYASAEQKKGKVVDEKSDLFSLGKLAKELLAHTKERVPANISVLVQTALCVDPQGRPESVAIWKQSWEAILAKRKDKEKRGNRRIREIAVIGNEHGIGVTHVAFSLTEHLRSRGQSAFYVNRSGKAVLVPALRQRRELRERKGIIYHRDFAGIMDYGPAIPKTTPPDGIRIVDCGCNWLQTREAELIIYVIGSRPWQDQELLRDKVRMDGVVPIVTPINRGVGHKIARQIEKKVYGMPMDTDPMVPGKKTHRLWKGILRHVAIQS